MAMIDDEDRIGRLPVWARQLIAEQRADLNKFQAAHATFVEQIKAYEEAAKNGSDTFVILEPYRGISDHDKNRSQIFSIQTTVDVITPHDKINITVSRNGAIRCNSTMGRLVVIGGASNAFTIQSEKDLIAERASDLTEWEAKLRSKPAK